MISEYLYLIRKMNWVVAWVGILNMILQNQKVHEKLLETYFLDFQK